DVYKSHLMKSSILRKKILQEVSELFKVSLDSLNNEVGHQQDYYQPQSYQLPTVPQFNNLNKNEKAERALLKHFMNDKDTFLNYHKLLQVEDFTNEYFKRIFNVLHQFYSEHDTFNISDVLQYIDSNEIKEAFISLDNYMINEEPFEYEIDDYVNTLTSNRNEETIESLNHKLREASRLGDLELQKYYLEKIVNHNKNRMN
ncbi:DNA primase, partial [Staphylococcus equorum]|uniref:DnaB-like helicase N-terminal domain-containing protein n=1 Tax=Staphylococcus equorum TaxID=246432 RepID=UPI000FF1DBA5